MCVDVSGPVRIFGDIHGQLKELLRLFHAYVLEHTFIDDWMSGGLAI